MPRLPEICINRPVLATVISLILMVIGILGYNNLTTRFFPKHERNSLIISTSYPGASAKLVETSITTPLEKNVSGIEGIDIIESVSSAGQSNIDIRLKDGYDPLELANKVRNRVAMSQYELPSTVKPPQIFSGHGSSELLDYGFLIKNNKLDALRDYLDRYVVPRLQQVSGVASASVFGANVYAMRVWLDPQKLAAVHLDANDIKTAIRNANVEQPAGRIKGKLIEFPITAKTKLHTAKEFGNIIVKKTNNQTVRLSDVAHVTLGTDTTRQEFVRVNGKLGVFLAIYNNTSANPIATADRVKAIMHDVKKQLPASISIIPSWDETIFMRASVDEVYFSIALAIACVILVILAFLGRLRNILIPVVTIPICVVATFGILYFAGLSINMITLLAIVLSIGLIVDDAIVMLENIHRHIELGETPKTAATRGSREITFAVIAMTLTLAAVYAPIALIQGQAATFFRSFAFSLAGAVLISGLVALTLSPMMCAYLLKSHSGTTGYTLRLERFFNRMKSLYGNALDRLLRHRLRIVMLTLLIAVAGGFVFTSLPKGFMPAEDMGFLFSRLITPSGTPAEVADQQLLKTTDIIKQHSGVESIMSFTETGGDGMNRIFVLLKPYEQRNTSASALANQINRETKKVPGLNVATFAPSFGSGSSGQIIFYLYGAGNYIALNQTVKTLLDRLKRYPGLKQLNSNLAFNSQQYDLTVNRELASQLGVSVRNIDDNVAALLGGTVVSTFDLNGHTYDVYLQAEENYLNSFESLDKFKIKNDQQQLIDLGSVVSLTPVLTQPLLQHYNQLRGAEITAQLGPGYKLGEVVGYLQDNLPKLLPSQIKFAFGGRAEDILKTSKSMGMIFLLSIVFIYLVLSAQFESFSDPFVILFAVPFSIIGALAILKLANGSINIYTSIGLITLIGLIAKHGILITQFSNELCAKGKTVNEALIEAASLRLRPILMTTAAMIFGALPLVFATGASAISRREIGLVIVGGLFFGTFFSLILVPITYSYLHDFKRWIRNRYFSHQL